MNVVNRRKIILKSPINTANFCTSIKKPLYVPNTTLSLMDSKQFPTTTNINNKTIYYVNDTMININRE